MHWPRILPAFRRSRWVLNAVTVIVMMSMGFPVPLLDTGADETDPWESQDADGDGWSNGDESFLYFTDPANPSSYPGSSPSGNGDPNAGTNPMGSPDSDGDGYSDIDESSIYYTDPYSSSSYPGSTTSPGGAWLADFDGNDRDDAYGFWVGSYEGPLIAAFMPQAFTGPLAPGVLPGTPGVSLTFQPGGWPDGGPDSDQDGLSDVFEIANISTQVQTGVDVFGVPVYETVSPGLSPYTSDSDGDLIPDGWEVLALTPLMLSAGRAAYDPTVNEAFRDDDNDGIATAEEYLIWGTDLLNIDTDGDGLDDHEEIAILTSDPLDPADPGAPTEHPTNPENGGGTGGMDGSGSGSGGDGGAGLGGTPGSGSGGGEAGSSNGAGNGTAPTEPYPPMGFRSRTHSARPPGIESGGGNENYEITYSFSSGEYAAFQLPQNATILAERTAYVGDYTRFWANFYQYNFVDVSGTGDGYWTQTTASENGFLIDWTSTFDTWISNGWIFDSKWDTDWVGEAFTELDLLIQNSGSGGWAEPYNVTGPAYPGDLSSGVIMELESAEVVLANSENGSPFSGYLGGMGFGGSPWDKWMRVTHGNAQQGSYSSARASQQAEGEYPWVEWTEVWLQADAEIPAGFAPAEKNLVLHATSKRNGTTQDYFGTVHFTVPKSERTSITAPAVTGNIPSNWIVVDSSGAVNPSWFVRLAPPVEAGVVNEINILPAEILVPNEGSTSSGFVPNDLVSTTELKVAKWEDAFSTPGGTGGTATPDQDFNEGDVDRFYFKVAMPWKEGQGNATVKIKTDNDPENEIEVVEIPNQPGTFRTNGLILVSDEVDDTFDNLDEGLQDTTHRVKLGDTITFTVDVPNGNPVTFEATVPARAEIDLTVKSYSATGVRSSGAVDDAVKAIEAAYAQVGIRVNPSVATDLSWPVNTLNDGVLNIYNMGANGDALSWRQEYLDFIDTDRRGVGSDFRLFFVRSVGELGIAVNREDVNQLQDESLDNLQDFHEYTDNAFVSDGMAQKYFTPAHELLHLMILELYGDNGGHSTVETDLIRAGVSAVNRVGATKRISQEQEDYIYQHPFVKPVEE